MVDHRFYLATPIPTPKYRNPYPSLIYPQHIIVYRPTAYDPDSAVVEFLNSHERIRKEITAVIAFRALFYEFTDEGKGDHGLAAIMKRSLINQSP